MKIAFFGSYHSFDYYNIGGTDSIARRLAKELLSRDDEVAFIHFGSPLDKHEVASDGISLFYFRLIDHSLSSIAGNFDHIITIYIPPLYRHRWILFRKKESWRTRFHFLYTCRHESLAKRILGHAEARLFPYNGLLFCVSPRLYKEIGRFFSRATLLYPPVPENYFLKPDDKNNNERLCITYLGRIDPGKGTSIALNFFQYLAKKDSSIETRICGFPWKHRPASVQLHEQLLNQKLVPYIPSEYKKYSPNVDVNLREILRKTDVLFLPYKKLSSTIDTPLVLLEGMAHLCAVMTSPLGDIPTVYGTKDWMVRDINEKRACLYKLKMLKAQISKERTRLLQQCKQLKFNQRNIAEQFLAALETK